MPSLTIPRWGRFEAVLHNGNRYADPYRDVTLAVRLTAPDGAIYEHCGFFDGDTTWKIRWMPDTAGLWQFEARFSDGSGGLEGSFTCEEAGLPGLIGVDERNPQHFGFRGGDPFFMRSLHVGDAFFAANLPAGRRAAFLDWAQSMGYNTLSIGSFFLNRTEPGRGMGWETPRLWPLDAGAFQKAEAILDDLAARGMVVFPFGGFFGRGTNYPKDPADQDFYIRYCMARFGSYWNLLVNVSGPEPLLVKEGRVWIDKPELERMALAIRALDPYHRAITVHNQTGDDAFLHDNWVDYTTLQGPKTTSYAELYRGILRNRRPDRPLYAQETLWSGNKYHPQYSDEELRRNAIILNMAGAAINFIDNGGPNPEQQGDSSSGFSGTLDLADARPWRHEILRRVWDFFAAQPFGRMTPRPELVLGGNEGDPAAYCLAVPGERWLVYLPARRPVSLALGAGTYCLQWFEAHNMTPLAPPEPLVVASPLGMELPEPPQNGEDWFACITRD